MPSFTLFIPNHVRSTEYKYYLVRVPMGTIHLNLEMQFEPTSLA